MNKEKLSGFERLKIETGEQRNTIETYRLMDRTEKKLEAEIARKKAHRDWGKEEKN